MGPLVPVVEMTLSVSRSDIKLNITELRYICGLYNCLSYGHMSLFYALKNLTVCIFVALLSF